MTTLSSARSYQMAYWLAGHFNNFQQAIDFPTWFANIHVYQCPLPWHVMDGLGFYVEQVYDLYPGEPYRQRVVHLVDAGDTIRAQNFAVKQPERFLGAGRALQKLSTMTAADVEPLPGCVAEAIATETSFRGKSIPGKTCRIHRKGRSTYLVSEFELTETTFQSLDIGLDFETDEMIWGSRMGPFQFDKKESFAHLVPTGPDWVAPELPKPEKKPVVDMSDRVISI